MRVFDARGSLVEVGMYVDGGGTIVDITEPDGDVNSYGRPVAVGPFVIVQYVNPAARETWLCSPIGLEHVDAYQCWDITLDSAT